LAGIDDYDYEVSERKERIRFDFTVNFKKIYVMNTTLFENNADWDEHYPKDIFVTMLEGIWTGMTVLFCFSNGVLLIATLPFMFFYLMALHSTYKNWKEYKYKKALFWGINIAGLLLALTIGILVQKYVLKF